MWTDGFADHVERVLQYFKRLFSSGLLIFIGMHEESLSSIVSFYVVVCTLHSYA